MLFHSSFLCGGRKVNKKYYKIQAESWWRKICTSCSYINHAVDPFIGESNDDGVVVARKKVGQYFPPSSVAGGWKRRCCSKNKLCKIDCSGLLISNKMESNSNQSSLLLASSTISANKWKVSGQLFQFYRFLGDNI